MCLFLLLKDLDISSTVLVLHIKIGEILYSRDHLRTPRHTIQLYNCCWLHMELCALLFPTPSKLTRSKRFGQYLTSYRPTQHELLCLRSVDKENQESQAREIADSCTNHHACR